MIWMVVGVKGVDGWEAEKWINRMCESVLLICSLRWLVKELK